MDIGVLIEYGLGTLKDYIEFRKEFIIEELSEITIQIIR